MNTLQSSPKKEQAMERAVPPLAGAGLGGDALEALLLGVVGLGDGGVQLVGARGVVALKLVVDFGGGAQGLL